MNHTRELFDSPEFAARYHYDGSLGCFVSESGTVFRLWAPTAESVSLLLYKTGDRREQTDCRSMTCGERGVWAYETAQRLDGTYYTYLVTVEGTSRETADPYARACGCNGLRSMVIDLRTTDPEGWAEDRAPAIPPENIIYETHVKDFSLDPASGIAPEYRGKYLGLCQSGTTLNGDGIHATGFDYLKKLGITHLELMPVYDYGSVDESGPDSQFNWGYDPVNYNVPEGSYSTDPFHGDVRIRELKQAILALHGAGIRIIMDVVYNHTYHEDSWLNRTVPGYYYRRNGNGALSNGSGCGNDTASERSMCGKYILDSVLYWAEEYHIDGFRFDLMGLLPVSLMNEIRDALDARFGAGEKLVFGEPWRANATAVRPGTRLADKDNLTLLSEGVGAFCDATRDAVKGSLMDADARGFVNGGGMSLRLLEGCLKGWAMDAPEFSTRCPRQTISYLSSHDDWTLWDRLVNTIDPNLNYTGSDPDTLRANRLAAAILFCCQGNLFLLSGEEFGRTKQGIKNTYASAPEINRLDWNRAWQMQPLADYYRGLIALRRQNPGLRDKSDNAPARILSLREEAPGCAGAVIANGGKWARLFLVFNTAAASRTVSLPEGRWQLLADGENSCLWREARHAEGAVTLPPVSAAIFGQ